MRVSILIPTIQRLQYFKESLASARAQTHAELEILVSDDGSDDGTPEHVREVAAGDRRVRLVPPNPHPGLFPNINHLLGEATGAAFCILGDDDRMLPTFVERLARPLADDPAVVASFCDHWIIDALGRRRADASAHCSWYYGRATLAGGVLGDPLGCALAGTVPLGCTLYRASVFRGERFDPACGGAADLDYAVRAARLGPLYFVEERLLELREHAGSTTNTRLDYMIDGVIHFLEKYAFDGETEAQRLRILRSKYRTRAVYLSGTDRRESWRAIRQYRELGGRPLDPAIAAALALSLLPRRAAGPVVVRGRSILRRLQPRLPGWLRLARKLPAGWDDVSRNLP